VKTQRLLAEVRQVADATISTLGEDLRALLWHGAFARRLVTQLDTRKNEPKHV
jgi:hypothetical protein